MKNNVKMLYFCSMINVIKTSYFSSDNWLATGILDDLTGGFMSGGQTVDSYRYERNHTYIYVLVVIFTCREFTIFAFVNLINTKDIWQQIQK